MKKQLMILTGCTLTMFLIFMFSQNSSSGEPIILPILPEDPIEAIVVEDNIELQKSMRWIVDVKGEVQNPGVYEVESDLRINEVIKQAGGFTENANQNGLNLAQKIEDEMIIYVPHLNEDEEPFLLASQPGGKESKVSLNKASMEQLQTLPGIGAVKAQAIIEYRAQQGAFKSVEDLLKVSGIGSRTLESIRDLIGI